MRILVIGSGAREHALAWKLAQSPRVSRIFAAPGNPGIAACAECIPPGATHITELVEFAERSHIDLTVVGPEVPLVEGIVDAFRQRGLNIFGPVAAGAALEGSKAFAKELMTEAGIPTAQHRTFTHANEATAYLEEHGAPVVVKADGNAAGKGAIVALDMETARNAIHQMMVERAFGAAGDVVVIEDYLQGDEIGSTAICNGTRYMPLPLTQDHKRALDNDPGLNTGGMGVYTPLPFGGSPGTSPTGIPITGSEEATRLENVQIFHAGTALQDGRLVTAGGRVLSVAARGETLQEAVARVYEAAAHISFEGMHYRRDIAHRGLQP